MSGSVKSTVIVMSLAEGEGEGEGEGTGGVGGISHSYRSNRRQGHSRSTASGTA